MSEFNTIYLLPINQLVRSHLNCRDIDEKAVNMLVDQLVKGATLGPITCRQKGDKFEICSGQHRVEAHKRLGKHYIESYIKILSDQDFLTDSIRENINRKELTNKELWDNAINLYLMGKSTKDIAEILGITVTTARDYVVCGYFLTDHIKSIIYKRGIASLLCKITKIHQQPVYNLILLYPKITVTSCQTIIDNYIKENPGSQQKCSIKDIPLVVSHDPKNTIIPNPQPRVQAQQIRTVHHHVYTNTQLPPVTKHSFTPIISHIQVPTPKTSTLPKPNNSLRYFPKPDNLQGEIKQQEPTRTLPKPDNLQGEIKQQEPTRTLPKPDNLQGEIKQQEQQEPQPNMLQQRKMHTHEATFTINNSTIALTNDDLILLSQVIEATPQLWDLRNFLKRNIS